MVNLDKTISYSYNIIKGNKELSPAIEVTKWFGTMHDFKFKGQEDAKIPVDHIGLAQIAYEDAIKSFYFSKLDNEKNATKIFEPLNPDCHIADFVENYNPNIMLWYKNSKNKDLSMVNCLEGVVYRQDLSNFKPSFISTPGDYSAQDYRKITLQQALSSAINLYGQELVSNNMVKDDEQLNEVLQTENAYAQVKIDELFNKTYQLFANNDGQNQEQ